MKKMKPMDSEMLREQGHIMVDFIADYYKNLEDSPQDFPVLSQVQVCFFSPSLFIYKNDKYISGIFYYMYVNVTSRYLFLCGHFCNSIIISL